MRLTSAGVLAIAAYRGEQFLLLRLAGGGGGGGGNAWEIPPPAQLSSMQAALGGGGGGSSSSSSGIGFGNPSTTIPSPANPASSAAAKNPAVDDTLKRAAAEATRVATGIELFEFIIEDFIEVRASPPSSIDGVG